MRRWIPWILVVVLVAVGGLAVFRWVVAQVEDEALNMKQAAANLPAATPVQPIISSERMLDPNLDPQSRENLAEKLDMQNRKAADQAVGEAHPAPKDRLPPAPTVEKQVFGNSSVHSGIFPGSDGMIKPEQAQINNYWQGMIDGKPVMVMAGSDPQDTTLGLVILLSSDGFSVTGYERVTAPAGMSSLTIIDVRGTTLNLQDSNGKRVVFDLMTRTFGP